MASLDTIEVVASDSRSRIIARDIMDRYDYVSIDCEGYDLGPRGKLTLLQLCTPDHQAYLFDIQLCPDILKTAGGLKEVLQSDRITKVIHAGDRDSGALKHQYNIRLRNVHDTQVMHLLWEEEVDGVTFPRKKGLNEIAEKYGGQLNVDKSIIGERIRYERDLWTVRPLTREMIDYAAGDVQAIVPNVYREQKRLLASRGLTTLFNERCEENVVSTFEDQRNLIRDRRQNRSNAKIQAKCPEIIRKYGDQVQLSNLNEEEHELVKRIRWEKNGTFTRIPAPLVRLRKQLMVESLDRIEEQLKDPRSHVPGHEQVISGTLVALKHYPERAIQQRAHALYQKFLAVKKQPGLYTSGAQARS